uniref:Uncharacterized protein n=1 Tax=Anguilla anguilla TaxID=7936 RepID=A0A0E9W7S3_ANGAN
MNEKRFHVPQWSLGKKINHVCKTKDSCSVPCCCTDTGIHRIILCKDHLHS